MRRIKKIHFVGIGGSGMSGIAEVLLNLEFEISGSDINKNSITKRLSSLGVQIAYSHIAENVADCDVVVVSSAIPENNIEVYSAKKRRIPVVPRAEMLAELMRFTQGIAVAGTHGKTTTTSLIASLLAAGDNDPTFVIGGKLNSLGINARLGTGKYFVAEADESDASFLHLTPIISVVTNIDEDHMPTYDNDVNKLKNTFLEFLHRIPFYGLAVVCIDDPGVKDIYAKICKPILTYGFSEEADIKAFDWEQHKGVSIFKVKIPWENEPLCVQLNLPGKHNVLNALAAISIALEAGVSKEKILSTLKDFQGIRRRFQIMGKYDFGKFQTPVTLVDDYGHHPREVKAVIDSICAGWPEKRCVMVYQPHRYTRTKDLFDDFSSVLSEVDVLIMLDVYSAGEEIITGADSKSLCGSIRARGKLNPIYVSDKSLLLDVLQDILQGGDILLMQGAGDIGNLSKQIANEFSILSNSSVKDVI